MVTSGEERINWSAIAALAGVVGVVLTVILALWEYSPVQWRLPATLIVSITIFVICLALYLNLSIRGFITSHARTISIISIGILIPLSQILILGYSPKLLATMIIQVVCIMLMISLSQEWRTAKVIRTNAADDKPFIFLGFIDDEVGRGPGRAGADGAVDATFRLKPGENGEVISKIKLSQMKDNSSEPTYHVWDSNRHKYYWVLGVSNNGSRILPNRKGHLNITVSDSTDLLLFASDSWWRSKWFQSGKRYEAEIFYKNRDDPIIYEFTIL